MYQFEDTLQPNYAGVFAAQTQQHPLAYHENNNLFHYWRQEAYDYNTATPLDPHGNFFPTETRLRPYVWNGNVERANSSDGSSTTSSNLDQLHYLTAAPASELSYSSSSDDVFEPEASFVAPEEANYAPVRLINPEHQQDPYINPSYGVDSVSVPYMEEELMQFYKEYMPTSYALAPEYQYCCELPTEFHRHSSDYSPNCTSLLGEAQLLQQSFEKEKSQYETVEEVTRAVLNNPMASSAARLPEMRSFGGNWTVIHRTNSNSDQNFSFFQAVANKIRDRRNRTENGMEISRCNLCQSFSVALTPRGISEFMKLHLFSHAKKNPFCCKICGKCETTNPSKVRAHIRKRHPEKKDKIKENLVDRRPELDARLCELANQCYD